MVDKWTIYCKFNQLNSLMMLNLFICLQEDLFMKAFPHVGKLKKIKIGHDRMELSKYINPGNKSQDISNIKRCY